MLPWDPKILKFSILFKMCKKTNKICFCAGFAFYMLVYYCSTGYESLNIINGNCQGSPLMYIYTFPTFNLKITDVFLDNDYGDFYAYSQENGKSEWIPISNCGLHYKKNFQREDDIKYLIKSDARHYRINKDDVTNYRNNIDECF